MKSKGQIAALRMLDECGIDDPTSIPLELIVAGRGATLRFAELNGGDGRIVRGTSKAIITINSNIEYEGKRRFTIAHELGHYEMHDRLEHHYDSDNTLEYFRDGNQESEANSFASELLMPEVLFRKVCEGQKFSPDLLHALSERFKTSITSVAYRFFDYGNHPICLVYSLRGKVIFWKRPEDYPHFIIDYSRLTPPEGSVAREYFDDPTKLYPRSQSKQHVWKSDWFKLNWNEQDQDTQFYEYCIVTPKYQSVLSVIWEEATRRRR
jgi:hypothetical protein